MKLGLDIHGVLDKFPFLRDLAALLVSSGHEVHVITGAPWGVVSDGRFEHAGIAEYLLGHGFEKGIHYTHFYSIVDHHTAIGTEVTCDEKGCWLDHDAWNSAKAKYCAEHGIDLHIDDTEEYGKLFTTPVAIIK